MASWELTIYGEDSFSGLISGEFAPPLPVASVPSYLFSIRHYRSLMQCKWSQGHEGSTQQSKFLYMYKWFRELPLLAPSSHWREFHAASKRHIFCLCPFVSDHPPCLY